MLNTYTCIIYIYIWYLYNINYKLTFFWKMYVYFLHITRTYGVMLCDKFFVYFIEYDFFSHRVVLVPIKHKRFLLKHLRLFYCHWKQNWIRHRVFEKPSPSDWVQCWCLGKDSLMQCWETWSRGFSCESCVGVGWHAQKQLFWLADGRLGLLCGHLTARIIHV